ncbi:MAG: DUF4062 domain-containing protein [Pyrinomonadaceae bacterium]
MSHHADVMISSTALDLPVHRKEVMEACLRQGMFPKMMEHLPASDAEAISTSIRLVNEAEIYVGVFANRYGYIPQRQNPRQISITEMEYGRAIERGISRLIFVMDDSHPPVTQTVEVGQTADKLKAFKERLQTENIVNFFSSPADLRGHVINSLSQLRKPELESLHYISEIPAAPTPYIAHPYTLLQTHALVGRRAELKLLSDWVSSTDADIFRAPILSVVAVGGLGKSALTWKWFSDIAPQVLPQLAGQMWWSFYESDASFDNFVTRALAYVSGRPLAEVRHIPQPDREAKLLAKLDREPYLIVMDGFERELLAYSRMDAAHLSDEDLDRETANSVARPSDPARSSAGEHRLRKTADPRVGAFLRKLTSSRSSRILISTRLYPADLQSLTEEPLPGCAAKFLEGLSDYASINLWRSFKGSGSTDTLGPLFRRLGNHPLLIQALASEVARYRKAPGDFDRWQRDHPDFDPFHLPLVQAKSHVLEFALKGLDQTSRRVLETIAAFRMPAGYETISALVLGQSGVCSTESELDLVLAELEDRGLLGWDKRANRYDLHPIVRGVVWSGLGIDRRQQVYSRLNTYFEAIPLVLDPLEVKNLDELAPAIERYSALIGLERFDDAFLVFRDRISQATLRRLSAGRQRVELLGMFFPDGPDADPRGHYPGAHAFMLNALAAGHQLSGQPGRATPMFQRYVELSMQADDDRSALTGLCNLSDALRLSGQFYKAEAAVRRALRVNQELRANFGKAVSLQLLGLVLGVSGRVLKSKSYLLRALRIFASLSQSPGEGVVSISLAQLALWRGLYDEAGGFARVAWEKAQVRNNERDFIVSARLHGTAELGLNHWTKANELLHQALTRARAVNDAENEAPALVALAVLSKRQGEMTLAREFLENVWEIAERGPYPIDHTNALNLLAQMERDSGNTDAAAEAATKAYRLSWCDGPPFSYYWGLEAARKHLCELGAPEPELPAFDPSKFEPMPEVEIDPADELNAGAH